MAYSSVLRILAIIVLYLFLELLAFGSLKVISALRGPLIEPNITELNEEQMASLTALVSGADRSNKGFKPDPVLGWEPASEANSAGMRDMNEYAIEADEGILRIAAFGDSFTYASDVAVEESWGQQLMKLTPSIQLFNFGSGAYGLDQAYLRYRENKRPYKADIVLLGYMSENIARNVNVFRPFYNHAYRTDIFTKPRFKVVDNGLVLLPNPISSNNDQREFLENHREILAELGENDYHYQVGYSRGLLDFSSLVQLSKQLYSGIKRKLLMPIFEMGGMYSTRSEAFEVTKNIFDAFYREVLAEGSLPIIVVFPDRNDHSRSRTDKARRYQPLLDYFDEAGYPYIDILDAVIPYEDEYSIDDLTVQWGHFSPIGNVIIAEYIAQYLDHQYSMSADQIEISIASERERLGVSK